MSPLKLVTRPVEHLGESGVSIIEALGLYGRFAGRSISGIFKAPFKGKTIVKEVYKIGVASISIIVLTGFFTGMVLGIQGYTTLARFASEGLLGSGVVYTLLAELGPVISALLLTGRAGSALCAEIAVMQTTDQVAALECMAIDVYNFLISPKLTAGIISSPLLIFMFCASGVFGGYIAGVVLLGVDPGSYFNGMIETVDFKLLRICVVKSFAFAFLMVTVCSFNGFYVFNRKEKGAAGVSEATTMAVVVTSVWVLLLDYLLTSILI